MKKLPKFMCLTPALWNASHKQSFHYFGVALKLEVNSFRCYYLLLEKPQVSYVMLPEQITLKPFFITKIALSIKTG